MTSLQELTLHTIEEVLRLLGITEVNIAIEDRAGRVFYNLKTPDSNLLIGQYGQNLKSLQHIIRILVRRKLGHENTEVLDFGLDVEGYRREREEFLEALARKAASRVRETKQLLILKPMGSADRKIIHSFLSQSQDLTTESVGEEPERRIVIKLKT